jgi:DNA-directed RNA polymerase specialized sigma24 family protein
VTNRATVSLELEDLRLVAAAKAGDKHAYGQLLTRHQVAVFHAAYLHTGSAAQAQTVTLQAFVQGWGALRRLPATAPFRQWVLSLVALEAPATTRAGADLPAAPDLSEAVLAALEGRPRRRRHPGLAGVVAAAAIVAIAAMLVVPALRRPVGSYSVASARPATLTPFAGSERFPLGQRIPLYRARHAAGFTTLMPPTPGGAYLGRDVPGGRVSVIAGRMLITEFRGAVLPYILTLIGPGTHAKLTWVNGRLGVYGSSVHAQEPGDVLTWLQGPVTVRIEGAGTLEQALALARTLR